MSEQLTFQRNTFQETMVGLEYSSRPGRSADIFSRACVEVFVGWDWARYGYPFTQVFEPGVLQEVALLEGVPHGALEDLSHRPTVTMRRLGDVVDGAAGLDPVARINLAASLANISRFNLAERVLGLADPRHPREVFEVAWLEFVISNRRDDGHNSPAAFTRMRSAVTSGEVPRSRILDACTQAVVWYLKRREVSAKDFRWFVALGKRLADAPDHLDPSSISSWYRGLAMLPAAKQMPAETRSYMTTARVAAEQALEQNPGALELNFIKTYHESALKEHMHVTGDRDRAVEAGQALIDLDPVWAPSHGELADAYDHFGDTQQAADLFTRAARLGPPYVSHHLRRAADCWERFGDHGRSQSCRAALAELAAGDRRLGGAQLRPKASEDATARLSGSGLQDPGTVERRAHG